MKPLILVVEDHEDILYNIQMTLEFNDYQVYVARNGKEAMKVLDTLKNPPDLIISDIMMPEMDGYEFFLTVSENPNWTHIPFFFLSARITPEDVRFGKMLGADDYITKPFNEEDLLASIAGKLSRIKKMQSISQRFEVEIFSSLEPSVPEDAKSRVLVLWMVWDDVLGPIIKAVYPSEKDQSLLIENTAIQLYQTTIAIYGQTEFSEAQGILLNIDNLKSQGYLFFDFITNLKIRGGKQQYMLACIAPKINYFESLKIKELFQDFSSHIKNRKEWKIKECWEQLVQILTTPLY